MAFTITRYPSDFGNKKVTLLDITADASTQTVDCGYVAIECINTGYASMNSSNIHIAVNSNASGVQSMGVLGISGCTSGDRFFVTVYGH